MPSLVEISPIVLGKKMKNLMWKDYGQTNRRTTGDQLSLGELKKQLYFIKQHLLQNATASNKDGYTGHSI